MSLQFVPLGVLLLVSAFFLYYNRQVQTEGKTILEAMNERPELSEAITIINRDKRLLQLMKTRSVTAFIPTNDALEKYQGPKDKLFYYHLASISYKAQDLPESLNTELIGNQKLFVTRIPNGKPSISGWEDYDYYINNAKITSANHIALSEVGHEQVFHVVDLVIAPTMAKLGADGLVSPADMNPDARKLLEKPNLYGLVDEYSTTAFEKRVSELDLLDTFAMHGRNTFFILTDQALNNILDKDLIDKDVIYSHIVPKEVLFTRSAEARSNKLNSLPSNDNLRVLIEVVKIGDETEDIITYYVRGETVDGYASPLRGIYVARIVKGNIPVKNGVVHLIDRPLMIKG